MAIFCCHPTPGRRLVVVSWPPRTDSVEATTDCANFFAPSAEVSMQMLAIIVGSTGGVIACCAVLGIMVVRHVQPLGEGMLGCWGCWQVGDVGDVGDVGRFNSEFLQHPPTQFMAGRLVVWLWQKTSPPKIELFWITVIPHMDPYGVSKWSSNTEPDFSVYLTREDITSLRSKPARKNAMEDVATTNDQGPPATGCFARLMRRGEPRWGGHHGIHNQHESTLVQFMPKFSGQIIAAWLRCHNVIDGLKWNITVISQNDPARESWRSTIMYPDTWWWMLAGRTSNCNFHRYPWFSRITTKLNGDTVEIPDPTSTHGVGNGETPRRQELRRLPGCKRSRPRQRCADSRQEGER